MPLPEAPEQFAELLAGALPARAEPFAGGGAEGYAWSTGAPLPVETPAYLAVYRDGRAEAGLALVPAGSSAPRVIERHLRVSGGVPGRAAAWAVLRDLRLDGGAAPRRAPPDPDRLRFCLRFVGGVDYEALRLLAETGASDPDAFAWLACDRPDRARRHSFARAYPWAVDLFLESGAEFWGDTDEDAAADLVRGGDIRGCGPDGAVRAILRRAHGTRFPGADPRAVAAGIRAASLLPREWVPEAGPDLAALVAFGPHLRAFAALSGRTALSEAMRPGPLGWEGQLDRLTRKAGPGLDPSAPAPARLAWLARAANDMVDAFGQHVVRPAAMEVAPGLSPAATAIRGGRRDVLGGGRSPVALHRAACRILMGGKSLPGFVEAALRWHASVTPIANVVARIASDREVRWPAAFETQRDRHGIVVECLSGAGELHDEGADLRHCVTTYLERCLSGESAIASVRTVDAGGRLVERLSTVELAPGPDGHLKVVQHQGIANGPPPDAAEMALRRFMARVASGEVGVDPAAFEGGAARAAQAGAVVDRIFAGRYAEMAAAWAPHLPVPLRGAGPGAMLAAGGISPDALRAMEAPAGPDGAHAPSPA